MAQATAALLNNAVIQSQSSIRSSLFQRFFSLWFNSLIYNQIWEDPEVDLKALKLDSQSRLLSISSAGCNILSYLKEEIDQIHAVDLNPYHAYLSRLKLCAMENLPTYEDFFNFFALGKSQKNIDNYYTYIQPQLDEPSRIYWEEPVRFFRTGNFSKMPRISYFKYGFYNFSKSAFFIKFLHKLCKLNGCDPKRILQARTPEEQARYFDQYLAPAFDSRIVNLLSRFSFIFFSLGIPPQQYAAMKREANSSMLTLLRERVRRLAVDFPIKKNYFASQAFGLDYNHIYQDALPPYLQKANYDAIKENLPRLKVSVANFKHYLRKNREVQFNRFSLLDAQDWMTPQSIRKLWLRISQLAEPGARIIFRTAARNSPIEASLQPALMNRFSYFKDFSEGLHKDDRSAIYGGFHVYQFNG